MPVTITEDQQHIIDFLKSQSVAVLATVSPTGEPHVAAVYFTFNEHNMNFFFITKRRTAKSNNLEHNDQIGLAIYEADSQTTVQIKGTATEEKDENVLTSVFQDIWRAAATTSKSDAPPTIHMQAGPYVAYRVVPDSVRMARFIRPETDTSTKIFETI